MNNTTQTTTVDRAWFSKGATLIAVERDCSKSMTGEDREVRYTVSGTRKMADGTLRVKMIHQYQYGLTLVVPSNNEIKFSLRPAR